jgi:hypothetical protein
MATVLEALDPIDSNFLLSARAWHSAEKLFRRNNSESHGEPKVANCPPPVCHPAVRTHNVTRQPTV